MQEAEGRSEQAAERDRSERHQQLKSEEEDVDKNPLRHAGRLRQAYLQGGW